MERLAAEDMSGPDFPVAQYLQLRDVRVEGNPRQMPEYRERCLLAVGLGPEVDLARYGHLRLRGDFRTTWKHFGGWSGEVPDVSGYQIPLAHR